MAFHVIQLRKVPKGTNGGISVYGTLASVFGGFVVGLAYLLVLQVAFVSSGRSGLISVTWACLLVGALSGLVGSMIDSVLGGLLQFSGVDETTGRISNEPGQNVKHISGLNMLSNNQVNFISSLITSVCVASLTGQLFIYYGQV